MHRLAREQQRAERPGEKQERDERDQGEHEREVAEHGVAVVLFDRAEPGHPDHSRTVSDGRLRLRRTGASVVLFTVASVRDDDDVRVPALLPSRPEGSTAVVTPGSAAIVCHGLPGPPRSS